jgi:anaerobic magnesium-protoporphyrin IX monomethyl ester cyclase
MVIKYKKILMIRLSSGAGGAVSFPRAVRPPYLLKYAQALLKSKGKYEIRLVDCLAAPLPTAQLAASTLLWNPDIIVTSSMTAESDILKEYCSTVRNNSVIPLIAVGQGVTADETGFCPGTVDLVLPGEAEEALVSFIEEFNRTASFGSAVSSCGRIPGKPFIVKNLDLLPFPEYSAEELRQYRFIYPLKISKKITWGHILSSRGCPNSCIFCSQVTRESYGEELRLRSAANVADEIERLLASGANTISFDDDNFTQEKSHVLALCREIEKRKLKFGWIAHARIDNVDDEMLSWMKRSGCVLLRYGIESGSNCIISLLCKTKLPDWNAAARDAFTRTRRAGIGTVALFLIGNPTETEEDIRRSIDLSLEIRPDVIQVSYFTPYPGSKAHGMYAGRMGGARFSEMYHYSAPAVNLSGLDARELEYFFGEFYRRFMLRPAFLLAHAARYLPFYFFNLGVLFELLRIRKYRFAGRNP